MRETILGIFLIGSLVLSIGTPFAEAKEEEQGIGAVYTMTNAPEGNQIVVFSRGAHGALTKTDTVATGGAGSGGGLDPLGSQHSLSLTPSKKWLLAVNAGSNEISVFRVLPDGIKLVDKVYSGGTFPSSVTIRHNIVYVLNAGSAPNITGFRLGHRGRLTLLPGASRPLPSTGGFAQVGFDPEGESLVVTDKAESKVIVYSVDDDGLPSAAPVTTTSNGATPFGFIFDERGRLIIVEVGANAISSYKLLPDESLQVISPSVANGQKAACWIAGTEHYLFTANPGSHTLSAYRLAERKGEVTLLNGAAGAGKSPLDLAATGNGRFLYALDPGNQGVDLFRIEPDGSLTNLGTADGGLSTFAQGIAVR